MSCTETYATLRIFSADLHPDTISEILGLKATQIRPRDENSRYSGRREHYFWAWCSRDVVDSTDTVAHVAAVVDRLKDRARALSELRDLGCDIDVANFWVFDGQGGPSLDADIMGELSRLDLLIWWDIYLQGKD